MQQRTITSRDGLAKLWVMILVFCSGPETTSGLWVSSDLPSTRWMVTDRNEPSRATKMLGAELWMCEERTRAGCVHWGRRRPRGILLLDVLFLREGAQGQMRDNCHGYSKGTSNSTEVNKSFPRKVVKSGNRIH